MNVDVKQALRFAGVKTPDENALGAARQAAEQVEKRASPRYTYRVFAVERTEQGVSLPEAGLILPGNLAKTMLAECEKAALLLCTLGAEFDRLLRTAQARDMAQALYIDACGSSFVEQGCDAAEKEIAAHHPGLYLTDRFSPGYGDLPLSLQRDFLRALNGEKRLGVCAAPSYLLNPMKSVTAVIGLSDKPQPARIRGCAYCAFKQNCAFRERGMTCASSA
ncbi:MAG: methionine synthase [Clostridia bacterium]|nr:methionine synthase [Clostridia bacterium]MBQ6959423.1 methionine synthase [Clostridia bacterium]